MSIAASHSFDLEIKTHIALSKLKRDIDYARLRCMTANALIDHISSRLGSEDVSGYITCLSENKLTKSEFEHLLSTINELAEHSEVLPSPIKAKFDRTICRLVRLLPSQHAISVARRFVNHPRKSRRLVAHSALRGRVIPSDLARKIVEMSEQNRDEAPLHMIAADPQSVINCGPDLLLEIINDSYWRARIIEGVIRLDSSAAFALGRRFPSEFAHAAGRVKDPRLLPNLRRLFAANSEDVEFLSLYVYALGKLKAKSDIAKLEKHIASCFSPELMS